MNGRVYDPQIGRFLSRDPLLIGEYLTQAINGYAYVHNSPLSFVDPMGYAEIETVATVTATRLYPELSLAEYERIYRPGKLRRWIAVPGPAGGMFGTQLLLGFPRNPGSEGPEESEESQTKKPDLCDALAEIAATADANPFLDGSSFDKDNLGLEFVPPGGGPIDNSHFLEPRNGLEYDVQWVQVGWNLTKTYGRNIPQQFGVGYVTLGAGAVSLDTGDASYFKNGNVGANMRGLQLGEFGAGNFETFQSFVENLCSASK